jgi:hypothetical protein
MKACIHALYATSSPTLKTISRYLDDFPMPAVRLVVVMLYRFRVLDAELTGVTATLTPLHPDAESAIRHAESLGVDVNQLVPPE